MPKNKIAATAKRIFRGSPKTSKKTSANMATESISFESNPTTATKNYQADESYPAASQTENDHVDGSSQSVAYGRNSSDSDLSPPPESPVQNHSESREDQATNTVAEDEQLSVTTIPGLAQPSTTTTPDVAQPEPSTTTEVAQDAQSTKFSDGKLAAISGTSDEAQPIATTISDDPQPSKSITTTVAQQSTSTTLDVVEASTSPTSNGSEPSTSITSDVARPPSTAPEDAQPETPFDTSGAAEDLESLDDGDDELSDGDDDNENQVDQPGEEDEGDEVDMMIKAYVEGKTQTYDFEPSYPAAYLETPASEEAATPAEGIATPAEEVGTPVEDGYIPAEEDATSDEAVAGNGALTADGSAGAENTTTENPTPETSTPESADAEISTVGKLATAPNASTGKATNKGTIGDDAEASLNTPELLEDGGTPTDDETPAELGGNDETDELLAAQLANEEERADMFDEANPESFTNTNKKTYQFKKLTDIDEFKVYLANPQDMSYDKLYQRTATVANIMKQYQDEYDVVQKELNDYEFAKKAKAKEAEEEAKVAREKTQKEEDVKLLKLLAKFPEVQGMKLVPWKAFQEKFTIQYGEKKAAWALPLLSKLKSAPHNAVLLKRKEAEALPAPKARFLVDAPYKGPTKSEQKAWDKEKADEEKLKRKVLIDPIVFEDRKMADVYGFQYSDKPEHIGNQPLDVRNDAELSKTGVRETRARNNKRKTYETDDGTPAVSEEEQLPAKRVRKARNLDDGPGSPAGARSRTAPPSRSGSPGPAPRTFASGKRIGRPPGSKTKSKLNKSVVASAEEEPKQEYPKTEDLTAEALPAEGKAVKPSINGEENNEVVAPTPGGEVAPPQPKKKHPGGRPRGGGKKVKSEPTVEEAVIASEPPPKAEPAPKPKPTGRGRRKRAPSNDPEDNVLPSTEKDESGSDSRPTTSSSANTASTTRRQTRSATRGVSAPPNVEEDPAPRGNKRKRVNNSTIKVVPPIVEEEGQAPVPAPALKKRKTATAKIAPSAPAPVAPATVTNSTKRKVAAAPPPQVSSESDAPLVPPPPNPRKRKAAQASSESIIISEEPPAPAPAPKRARTAQPKNSRTKAKDSSGEESEFKADTTQLKKGVRANAAARGSSGEESEFKETTAEAEEKEDNEEVEEIEVPKRKMAPRAITKCTPAIKSLPPPSRKSARERKPTDRAMGLDGADDDSEEEIGMGVQRPQFTSEYERYQALTSPGGSMSLGKRVRKARVDLASFVEPGSEEEEEEELFTN